MLYSASSSVAWTFSTKSPRIFKHICLRWKTWSMADANSSRWMSSRCVRRTSRSKFSLFSKTRPRRSFLVWGTRRSRKEPSPESTVDGIRRQISIFESLPLCARRCVDARCRGGGSAVVHRVFFCECRSLETSESQRIVRCLQMHPRSKTR